jgi:hypothetical protein
MWLAEALLVAAVIAAHKAYKIPDDRAVYGWLAIGGWLACVTCLLIVPTLGILPGAYATWVTWEWWRHNGDGSSQHRRGRRALGEKSLALLNDLLGRLLPTPDLGAAA